jgi:hypothetical protein
MSSVGEKTLIEPKLYIFSFLALGTLNHDKVDVMCIALSSLRCYLHHWSVMTPCDEG